MYEIPNRVLHLIQKETGTKWEAVKKLLDSCNLESEAESPEIQDRLDELAADNRILKDRLEESDRELAALKAGPNASPEGAKRKRRTKAEIEADSAAA